MDVRASIGARPRGMTAQQIVSGQVSAGQPLPASFTDPLYVVCASISTEVTFGPFQWPESHGSTLPTSGDTVVIGIDQNDVMHILGWDPA
jgi:hypothetical protein